MKLEGTVQPQKVLRPSSWDDRSMKCCSGLLLNTAILLMEKYFSRLTFLGHSYQICAGYRGQVGGVVCSPRRAMSEVKQTPIGLQAFFSRPGKFYVRS